MKSQRQILENCNVLVRWADDEIWQAAQRYNTGEFRDHRGLEILPPQFWRYATLDQILGEYDDQGLTAMIWKKD